MRYKLLLLFLLLSGISFGQSTYTVTKLGDYNPDSLYDAEDSALAYGTFRWEFTNAALNGGTVEFNITDSNTTAPYVIELYYPLPYITQKITIDGMSQYGYDDSLKEPVIIIDGEHIPSPRFLFFLETGSSGSVINGLLLRNIHSNGILVYSDSVSILNNVFNNIGSTEYNGAIAVFGTYANISGNYIGVDISENNAYPIIGRGVIISINTSMDGSSVIGSADKLNRMENVIANTSSYAIEIKNGPNYNRIYYNKIYNTQGISLNKDGLLCGNICKNTPEISTFIYDTETMQFYIDGFSDANDSIDLYSSYGANQISKYYASLKADSVGFWSYAGLYDENIVGLVCIATDSMNNSSEISNYKLLINENEIDTASPSISDIIIGEEGTGMISGVHIPGEEVYLYKLVEDFEDTSGLEMMSSSLTLTSNQVALQRIGTAYTLDSSKWVVGNLNVSLDDSYVAMSAKNVRIGLNLIGESTSVDYIKNSILTKLASLKLGLTSSISSQKATVCPEAASINTVQKAGQSPQQVLQLLGAASASPQSVLSLFEGALPTGSGDDTIFNNLTSITSITSMIATNLSSKSVGITTGKSLPSAKINQSGEVNKDISFMQKEYGFVYGAYYSWDFGDGTSSQDFFANHVYKAAGEYEVYLTINPNNGCSPISGYKTVKIESLTKCSGCKSSGSLSNNRKYVVSGWVKEKFADGNIDSESNQGNKYSKASIEIVYYREDTTSKIKISDVSFTTVGEIIDGWQKIEGVFVVPTLAVSIEVKFVNNSADKNIYFDDIRIHPYSSEVKTYAYDRRTLRPMAELDGDNYATIYEYDVDGNVIRVKKETSKGKYTVKETRSNTIR
ncbi:MAG: hypothetical protein A2X12_02590 [Bacteroidetes bacterium GWE2_29_8]|nr:MAG: hypothetical protein A2X12_02590 [Bacteroidetes bacterium GWE2_29_8]